jgi:hypothetical protein
MWRLSGEESWQPFNVGALSDREERPLKADKYIGMDVHQATTVVVVLNGEGKVVLETIVATEGAPIVRLLQGLSGTLRVTFEETTQAAWLYEMVRAYVAEVIVCDPRRNRLLSVDLALWTLGFPEAQVRSARLSTPPGGDVEELALAELDLGGVPVSIACSWHLHAGRDAVIEAAFYGAEGGAALRNVDGSFYDLRAERYRGTATETLCEPPDEWGGRAAVEWARRLAAGERFDAEAHRLVTLAAVLDAIYEEAACVS